MGEKFHQGLFFVRIIILSMNTREVSTSDQITIKGDIVKQEYDKMEGDTPPMTPSPASPRKPLIVLQPIEIESRTKIMEEEEESSIDITCPLCYKTGPQKTYYEMGRGSYLASLALTFCGLCFIPCIWKKCKDRVTCCRYCTTVTSKSVFLIK